MNQRIIVRIFLTILAVVIFTAIAAIVIIIASGGPVDGEKVEFSLKLEKGQKYYIKTVNEQKISQTVMSQPQNIEQTTGIGMNLDVNDVDEQGNLEVICTYTWTQFNQKGSMGIIEYDSSKKEAPVPPLAQGYAAIVDEGFLLKLAPGGYVLSIAGLDKMRDNIRKKLPEGSEGEQIMSGLQQFVSDNAIRQNIRGAMAIYPDNPVGIGDTWTKKVDLLKGGAMSVESNLTLKERKDGVATIEVISKIEPIPNSEPIDVGPVKMTHKLSGTQKGLMYVQESTGLIIHSKVEQDISGDVTMTNKTEPTQELTIPTTIKGIVTTKMTERKE